MSDGPRNNACPPRRFIPVSVETRVRVDRFWKIMAVDCPVSGLGAFTGSTDESLP